MGIIFFLILTVYSGIWQNRFLMGDFSFIVDWPFIQDWGNWKEFFTGYPPPAGYEGIYSPLKILFHAFFLYLFGTDPTGYHAVALIIHLVAVFFVYRLSYHFVGDHISAFCSSLFFGLHPVNVEAITYMSASVDTLGIVFLFMSFYCYVRARQENPLNRKLYSTSFILAVLAVFTNELAMALPLLFLWYDYCYPGSAAGKHLSWRRIVPFFAVAVFYFLAKFAVLKDISHGDYLYDSFYLTMLVTVKALAKYVLICLFPFILTHNHAIAPGIFSFDPADFDRFAVLSQSPLEIRTFVSLVLLGSIIYFAWRRFPKEPLITFCIGWFFIALLPVAQIIPNGAYFAERYLYPGTWAFCLLLAFYLRRMMQLRHPKWAARLSIILFIWIGTFYAARVWMRNQDWKNEVTFYQSAVRTNPQSALMQRDLGIIYTKYDQPHEALNSFKKALSLRPDDPVLYFSMAETYIQLDDKQKSAEALEQAIVLNPQYAAAHYNLAGLYMFLGRKEEALEHFHKAISFYREQESHQEADKWEKAFKDFFLPGS